MTSAPYAPGNKASRAAADKIAPKTPVIRQRVFDYIKQQQGRGATGSEIAAALNVLPYTAKPRCTELAEDGYIVDTGTTRENSRGNAETVWKVSPKGEGSALAPRTASSPKKTAKEHVNGQQATDSQTLTKPDRLDLGPVRMAKAEIMDIENWIRETTFTPSGHFTPQREVAKHVQKLVRIYKSFIA